MSVDQRSRLGDFAPLAGLAAVVLALGALGCAGSGSGRAASGQAPDPSVINQSDATNTDRISAIRGAWASVERGEADHATVRESLKRVSWSRSTWVEVRTEAVRALLEDTENEPDTRNMMRLMLPTETAWPMIAFIGDTGVERGWTDLTAALVRSWSRPVREPTDDQRPERAALEGLFPGVSAVDTVYSVFVGRSPGQEKLRDRDRRDAWALLQRLDASGGRSVALLSAESPQSDPMLESLRRCAADFGAVPRTAEQLEWVERLLTPAHIAFWNEAASVVATLTPEQRSGLGIRHAAPVLWAHRHAPGWLDTGREQLLGELDAIQRSRKKHPRTSSDASIGGAEELLRTHRDNITWGDALAALIAARLPEDTRLARTLFAQAEDDRRDNSTEHGGVIEAMDGESFRAVHFPPRPAQRLGDRRFVASPDMIEQSAESLFHYHFHAQSYSNAEYAGPSAEDIAYADRFGRACLVLTFVARDALNIDYYLPNGVVLDLGEIRRPRDD